MSATRKKPSPLIRRIVVGVVVLALVAAAYWFWSKHEAAADSGYRTAAVERGDIRVAISATGTLAAISTVDVGSEISGRVTDVLVDFNDEVKKGQVIARIDPSTYEAQIAQGNAAIASARANLVNSQAALKNAQIDFTRKNSLGAQQLVARSDVDLARAARDQAQAQAAASQAQINQQIASTQTAKLNLGRTVIRAPVDGVVLTRTVEPGQTVAASLQAPVLFQIAEDLSKMEIVLAIDEADIGQVKAGQNVSFNVDAFPDRQFRGQVQQVRLSATNTNNVITYPVVVTVDNADQALLPGLTVNAEIEVSRRDGVLKVPNSALRYKPPEEDGATPATAAQPGARGASGASGVGQDLPRIAAALKLDTAQQAAFDEASKAMQQAMQQRMAARAAPADAAPASGGGGSTLFGRGGGGRNGGNAGNNGNAGNSGAMRQRMLERFNQQFAAFRATLNPQQQKQWDGELAALASARRAPLYKLVDGKPEQVMVRIGASDGSDTEVSGNIREGDQVVIGSQRAAAKE